MLFSSSYWNVDEITGKMTDCHVRVTRDPSQSPTCVQARLRREFWVITGCKGADMCSLLISAMCCVLVSLKLTSEKTRSLRISALNGKKISAGTPLIYLLACESGGLHTVQFSVFICAPIKQCQHYWRIFIPLLFPVYPTLLWLVS